MVSGEPMTDPITRLNAALEGRYRVEREIGEGCEFFFRRLPCSGLPSLLL